MNKRKDRESINLTDLYLGLYDMKKRRTSKKSQETTSSQESLNEKITFCSCSPFDDAFVMMNKCPDVGSEGIKKMMEANTFFFGKVKDEIAMKDIFRNRILDTLKDESLYSLRTSGLKAMSFIFKSEIPISQEQIMRFAGHRCMLLSHLSQLLVGVPLEIEPSKFQLINSGNVNFSEVQFLQMSDPVGIKRADIFNECCSYLQVSAEFSFSENSIPNSIQYFLRVGSFAHNFLMLLNGYIIKYKMDDLLNILQKSIPNTKNFPNTKYFQRVIKSSILAYINLSKESISESKEASRDFINNYKERYLRLINESMAALENELYSDNVDSFQVSEKDERMFLPLCLLNHNLYPHYEIATIFVFLLCCFTSKKLA